MDSLLAEKRDITGKKAKDLRQKGLLPAVAYGKGIKSAHIAVPYSEFIKVWKSAGESSLILLKLPEGEKNVLIHDVAIDPIKNIPIHADFYLVDMNREVEVDVPIEFNGEAEAGKTTGGILVKVMHELKVKSLPAYLPHSFVVDVSQLQNPKDAVYVKDLLFPVGVTTVADPNETIALIEEQRVVEEAAPVVASPDFLKDIEVIKPEKKEEETEEKTSSVSEK